MRSVYIFLILFLFVQTIMAQELIYPEDAYYSNRFGYPALGGAANIAALGNGVVYIARDVGQAAIEVYKQNNFTQPYGLAKWDGTGWSLEAPGDLNVRDMVVYGSAVIVAGDFTEINGQSFNYIASWDGHAWQSVGGGANGPVNTLATDGANLFAGGSFSRIGDTSASNVAIFDGSHWLPMYDQGEITQGTSGEVFDIVAGSSALVAGRFGTAGGVNASNVASWSKAPKWGNFSTGTNSLIRAITTTALGPVIGGDFSKAGGVDVGGVAYWDGADWQPMGNGANGQVVKLTNANGEAVAYGRFGPFGAFNISRFRNGQWEALGGDAGNITVSNLVSDGQNVWAGAQNAKARGVYLGGLAHWDNVRWSAPSNAIGEWWSNNTVNALVRWTDGSVIAGGAFSIAGGDSMLAIARWMGNGWEALGEPFKGSAFARINSLKNIDGKLYTAGFFNDIGGSGSRNIGFWDGSQWSGMQGGTDGEVYVVEKFGSDIFIGGDFYQVNGQAQAYMGRWDGAQWQAVSMPPSGTVYSMLSDGGVLYVGGQFSSLGDGTTMNALGMWDGQNWTEPDGGLTGVFSPSVHALTKGKDGIYVGGEFTMAGTVSANNIARWDGSAWHALGKGIDGVVYSLYANGADVYAGGEFSSVDGDTMWGLARWDGSAWQRMGNGVHLALNYVATPTVKSFLGTDEGLWIGGNFSHAGVNYSHSVALYTDFNPVTAIEKNIGKNHFSGYALNAAYPNPFNPQTTITFTLPRPEIVNVQIYDSAGRQVRHLLHALKSVGQHSLMWDGRDDEGHNLSSGVYVIALRAGSFSQNRKIILLK